MTADEMYKGASREPFFDKEDFTDALRGAIDRSRPLDDEWDPNRPDDLSAYVARARNRAIQQFYDALDYELDLHLKDGKP